MSGTRQTEFTLSGQSTDWANPDAVRIYVERIFEPTFKKVRNTVNQLARDILATSSSTKVDAKYGVVFVDATAGNVTLTLVTPQENFHPITVVKVDSSSHSVVVQASGGALISGSATDTFSKQWEVAQYESDSTKYARTFGGNMSLFGDVTGTADNNTVSKLQGVLLTIGTPATGAVLMYDGTQFRPIARAVAPFDTTYSPVGLWNFNIAPGVTTISDTSGNGNDLVVETGTMRTSSIDPSYGGVYFDGSTNLWVPGTPAVLRTLSACTTLLLFKYYDIAAARTLYSHGANGATSAQNTLYSGGMDTIPQWIYKSEHGAKVLDSANTLSTQTRNDIGWVGITRDSGGVLKHWSYGIFAGGPFGTVTLPTDGSAGHFRVGCDQNGSFKFTGVVASVAHFNVDLNATQMLYYYNHTLGSIYGYK